MNRDDDPRLLELASRIAEGIPVDWSDPASSEAELGPLAEELRTLEAIARQLRGPATPAWDGSPPGIQGFAVERELGRGGAGVVFLARDERLDRQVAIKVLPAEVALDPERIARIEREAKLLASLNHPHIAEALAAAHEGGVIHRDLKPGNVMLGAHGRVKVLDFGLALRTGPGADAGATIAGTWAYLSPECLARTEDHRADVFAFGCVLYECLAGARAFPGRTADETLAAVLGREPDWDALPGDTPDAVRRLIEECLAKDPAQRPGEMQRVSDVLCEVLRGSEAPAARPPVPGLPHAATSFIGRGREQTECRRALADSRLVTLAGPGGVGKTRLAIEVAAGMQARFEAGIGFVDLAPVTDPARVPDAVAATLAVRDDGRPLAEQIVDRLSAGRALLLLDNCEHVVRACAELARTLIGACPDLTILATSREPLEVNGERRIDLAPLALPSERDLADAAVLARVEAVRLFVERARRADPGFVTDAATLAVVAGICRRLDALPLAIELAAARVSVLGAAEIAARLDRQLQLLRSASDAADPRHATMRATVAWSADQLLPGEHALFVALAVFSGGWDLEAAHAVCATERDELDTLDSLSRLVDKSLVVVDRRGGATRYRMLEPVRQFAADRLAGSGRRDEMRGRHLAHFLALAERAQPHFYGADQVAWMERITADHDNLQTALLAAEELPGGAEAALRIVYAVRRLWITHGQMRLGEACCERALAIAGADVPPIVRGHGLMALGALLFRQNLDDRSRHAQVQRDALDLFRQAGDRAGMASCLHALGSHAMHLREFDAAQAYYAEALEILRELKDVRFVAIATHNLALMRWLRGDRAAALDFMLESEGLLRAAGDRSEHANGSVNLAFFQLRLGHAAEARGTLRASVAFFAEIGSRTDMAAAALMGVAEFLSGAEEFVASARMLGAADALLATTLAGKAYRDLPWDERAALEQRLETALGGGLTEAHAHGRAMPPADAFREALEHLGDPT